MLDELMLETEEKMENAIKALKSEYASLRAGRATPQMLDKIHVDYYGAETPVNQLANISVPEARLLVIQPWDKGSIPLIEKAILKSDIGITPSSDGTLIRLAVPQLTNERRQELVKQLKKMAEDIKVRIRNIRRDANDKVKKLEKEKSVTEDEGKISMDDIQKLTDKSILEVEKILELKEKEVTEI
jgi:ribosome recycling factor